MIALKKYLLVPMVGLVFITSCRKSFLDVKPQGQLTEELALVDPNAAEKVVSGAYSSLYFGGFGPTTIGFLYTFAGDVASDDADKGSTPGDFGPALDIDNFTVNSNNSILNNLWIGHYNAIARTNRAIDILNKSTFDPTIKNRLLGEARFLRGLYYFNLVRLFGGVPKLVRVPLTSEANNDEFQTRATAADIYQVINDDFQFAFENLPLKGATLPGRATKGAAAAYAAKAYLYQKNYQKAFDMSNEVINSNLYSLVADYKLIFRENPENGVGGKNNSESIFEVQTGINVNEDAVSPLFSNGQGARGKGGWNDLGFGFNNPSADLVSAYEPNDSRRAGTIIFINPTVVKQAGGSPLNIGTTLWDGFRIPTQDSVENSRYSLKAYHSALRESPQVSNNKDSKPKNIRLMRYADVLLINAEAAANLGRAEATTNLNLVRTRAGLPASVGTIANIWKERRVEMAMEQDRFFDLVRQGRAGTVLRALGKNFVDGKNEVFPIPQPQIDLSSGRLKQNPGY